MDIGHFAPWMDVQEEGLNEVMVSTHGGNQ